MTIVLESKQLVVTDKLKKIEDFFFFNVKMSPEMSVVVRLDPNIIEGLKKKN